MRGERRGGRGGAAARGGVLPGGRRRWREAAPELREPGSGRIKIAAVAALAYLEVCRELLLEVGLGDAREARVDHLDELRAGRAEREAESRVSRGARRE